MPKAKERELGFEESLSNLEKIVAQLESGDLPLERALELFETGVGLARRCQLQLEDAEHKVELLLQERGEIKVVPFDLTREHQSREAGEAAGDSRKSERLPSSGALVMTSGGPENEDQEKEEDLDDKVPF